jgi:hypothetical protein
VSTRSAHPSRPLEGPAATARDTLSGEDAARFERLAAAVLGSAALGPALRGLLPGTAGVRWLHSAGVAPTSAPTALTQEQWLSLFASATAGDRAPGAGRPAGRNGSRPSKNGHGHAPGAQAAPRWF